jgi:hypothetical protein
MCPHRAASLFTLTSSRRFRPVAYEVVQLQLEMDAKKALRSLPTFPKRPYKFSTIAIFSVFIFFLTIALLGLAKEFLIPLFR